MKNENEIKRAFAMEVIEKLENNKRTGSLTSHDVWSNRIIYESIKTVQSLLPKEDIELHPTTPEMQEQFVKANPEMKFSESDEVKSENETHKVLENIKFELTFKHRSILTPQSTDYERGRNKGLATAVEVLEKHLPTLEQKARKKAEEMYFVKGSRSLENIYQALLIDPKTL